MREGVDDAAQRRGVQLERGLIDNEAGADVHDALDFHQPVGLERLAAADQIDDGLRQARQRRQLHAAVELDEVHVHTLAGKKLARNGRIFGGHGDAPARAGGAGVVKARRHGHGHVAAGDAQVQRLVQARRALLGQHIQPGHAQVGAAVGHVSGHVAGAHEDDAHVITAGWQDELA